MSLADMSDTSAAANTALGLVRTGSLATRAGRGGPGRAGFSLDEAVEKQRERRDYQEAVGQVQAQQDGQGLRDHAPAGAGLQPGERVGPAAGAGGGRAGLARSPGTEGAGRGTRRMSRVPSRLNGIAEQPGHGHDADQPLGKSMYPSGVVTGPSQPEGVPHLFNGTPQLQAQTQGDDYHQSQHLAAMAPCSPAQYAVRYSSAHEAYAHAEGAHTEYLPTPQTANGAGYAADPRQQYLALPQSATPMLHSPQSASSHGDHFPHTYEHDYGHPHGQPPQARQYLPYEQQPYPHATSDHLDHQ